MRLPLAAQPSAQNALTRFGRNRRGATAVEFALIAPVFFAVLFAIIETAMVFFASQMLETGVQDSGRMLYTYQLQATGQTAAQQQAVFYADLCGRVSVLFDCVNNPSSLVVDVRSYPPGTAVNITNPIVGGTLTGPFGFNVPPINSQNTVVVRAFYQWPLFVTGLGFNLANLTGGKRLLSGSYAFHVEPQ
jgi:Flp pilus assembly protein TadG